MLLNIQDELITESKIMLLNNYLLHMRVQKTQFSQFLILLKPSISYKLCGPSGIKVGVLDTRKLRASSVCFCKIFVKQFKNKKLHQIIKLIC